MHKAKWWSELPEKTVKCNLCPRNCVIKNGHKGFCQVRKNENGQLLALTYGFPVALQVDPIEKKPLAEFMPGTWTFSLGTYGCNLDCRFCQNFHLSRGNYDQISTKNYISPESIIEMALKDDCKSIAFTYNEPTVFAEYAIDIAKLAKQAGLSTVLVSNGFINKESANELYPLIDAANIDMKGFSEEFYKTMTGTSLKPILNSIKFCFF